MTDAPKKIPLTELPVRVYRGLSADDGYLALIVAGNMRFTFTDSSALGAKRKAKDWAAKMAAKSTGRAAKKDSEE